MTIRVRLKEAKEIRGAIKALRLTAGISQEKLARLLGVTVRSVARFEKERPPNSKTLLKLVKMSERYERKDLAFIFERANFPKVLTDEETDACMAVLELFRNPVLSRHKAKVLGILKSVTDSSLGVE